MFGRGRRRTNRARPEPEAPEEVPAPEAAEADRERPAAVDRPGPYDVSEAPDDGIRRLDLGALRVPARAGLQVQFQVEESTGRPLTVVVTDGRSAMELSVFAAPKSKGLWDEVRAEILASLRDSGATEVEGRYGQEVRMKLPTGRPGEFVPGRMIGIDGPRWFLRAVLSGPAAHDPSAGALLEETLRRVIVVRGEAAMPVRDPLPLRLPKEVTEQARAAAARPGTQTNRLAMPAPGVRISETR